MIVELSPAQTCHGRVRRASTGLCCLVVDQHAAKQRIMWLCQRSSRVQRGRRVGPDSARRCESVMDVMPMSAEALYRRRSTSIDTAATVMLFGLARRAARKVEKASLPYRTCTRRELRTWACCRRGGPCRAAAARQARGCPPTPPSSPSRPRAPRGSRCYSTAPSASATQPATKVAGKRPCPYPTSAMSSSMWASCSGVRSEGSTSCGYVTWSASVPIEE